jgi:crossover junction endodeoxyribonuclease RusA
VYSLTLYGKRPISLNQERSAHFAVRVRDTKWWREGFADAAKAAGMPKLEACEIIVQPVLENRRWQDTGACFPSAKAAIDGLIDAEVIEDDTPDIVPTIAFKRPILGKQPGLKLTVIALESRVPGEEAVLGEQEPEVQVAASHARSKAGSKKASSRRRSPVSKSGR